MIWLGWYAIFCALQFAVAGGVYVVQLRGGRR